MPARVTIRPVERPEVVGNVVTHLGHWVTGPLGSDALSPRWTAFEDRDRATSHRCFYANAIKELWGDAFGTVFMDLGEVEVQNDSHDATLKEDVPRSICH